MSPPPQPSGAAQNTPAPAVRQHGVGVDHSPREDNAGLPDGSDVAIHLGGPYAGPAEPLRMMWVLWIACRHINGVIDSRESFQVRREFRDRRISALTRIYELEGFWLDDARRAGLELKQAMEIYTRVKGLAVDMQWYPDRPLFGVVLPDAGRTQAEEDGPGVDEWAAYYRMEDGPDKDRQWTALMHRETCRYVALNHRHSAWIEPLIQVWKVLGLRAAPPAAPVPLKPVVLHGQGQQPEVLGVRVPILHASYYRVVKALVDAGDEGLSKDEIDEKAKVKNGPTYIDRLRRRHPDSWGRVIQPAGKAGHRYRITWPG